MCWERMVERWADDVEATEVRAKPLADEELERPETWREPTKEPIEAEAELARV